MSLSFWLLIEWAVWHACCCVLLLGIDLQLQPNQQEIANMMDHQTLCLRACVIWHCP